MEICPNQGVGQEIRPFGTKSQLFLKIQNGGSKKNIEPNIWWKTFYPLQLQGPHRWLVGGMPTRARLPERPLDIQGLLPSRIPFPLFFSSFFFYFFTLFSFFIFIFLTLNPLLFCRFFLSFLICIFFYSFLLFSFNFLTFNPLFSRFSGFFLNLYYC